MAMRFQLEQELQERNGSVTRSFTKFIDAEIRILFIGTRVQFCDGVRRRFPNVKMYNEDGLPYNLAKVNLLIIEFESIHR